MKFARIGSLWGLVTFFLGAVACADQGPLVPEGLDPQFAKGGVKPDDPPVEVNETDPPAAEQDSTLIVRVLGAGFDRGSEATWLLAGVPKPDQVKTNSTKFVNDKELRANITISIEATVALWDVEVMTRRGKKGIGIESFQVKAKTPPGQVEFDDYIPIDLGTLGRRKGSSSASRVSERFADGPLLVIGRSQENAGSEAFPVMWEVTVTGMNAAVVGPTPMPLPPPNFFSGRAVDMSDPSADDSRFITGWVFKAEYIDGQALANAVRWRHRGGVDEVVTFEPFVHPTDPGVEFILSVGRGVNVHGDVVGNSSTDHPVFWDIDGDGENEFEAPRIATFWNGVSGEATPLLSPLRGLSIAYDVNNQRYPVGYGLGAELLLPSREREKHAVLWLLDGTPCDLGESGVRSEAYGITDLNIATGTFLVTGTWDSRGSVWEVRPNDAGKTCTVENHWTMEVESTVGGLRVLQGGWETVGAGQIITPGQDHPISWRQDSSGETVTPLGETGRANGVDGLGNIVGFVPVKDLNHAMLWIPKND